MNEETIGERIFWKRDELALTLSDLADISGVSADTICQIENGRRKPRPSTTRKLARAFDVPVIHLTRGETK